MTRRIAIFLFTAAAMIFQSPAANAQSNALAQAQRISGDRFNVVARTPRGATVYAVNQPNAAMLNTIDAGLTDLFSVARKNGYRRGLSYSNYTIFIARPDRMQDSAGNYSPDIAVGAAQYRGSVYDQGGFIYAALVRLMLGRLGVYKLIAAGGLVAGVGLWFLSLVTPWPLAMATLVIVGVGFYMIHNSLQTQATELAPTNRASAVAMHSFFMFLGLAFGPVVFGIGLAALGTA